MIQKNSVSRYYPYLNDGQRVSTIKAASSFNTALAKTNAKDRRTVQQIKAASSFNTALAKTNAKDRRTVQQIKAASSFNTALAKTNAKDRRTVQQIKAASSFKTALAKTNAKDRRTVQQIRVALCWKVNKQREIIACNRRHAYNKGHNKGDLSLSLINLMFSVDAKHHERRRPETPMAMITCTGMRVNRYTSSTTKVRPFRVWHKPLRKVRTCYVWFKTHPIASQLSSRVVY